MASTLKEDRRVQQAGDRDMYQWEAGPERLCCNGYCYYSIHTDTIGWEGARCGNKDLKGTGGRGTDWASLLGRRELLRKVTSELTGMGWGHCLAFWRKDECNYLRFVKGNYIDTNRLVNTEMGQQGRETAGPEGSKTKAVYRRNPGAELSKSRSVSSFTPPFSNVHHLCQASLFKGLGIQWHIRKVPFPPRWPLSRLNLPRWDLSWPILSDSFFSVFKCKMERKMKARRRNNVPITYWALTKHTYSILEVHMHRLT